MATSMIQYSVTRNQSFQYGCRKPIVRPSAAPELRRLPGSRKGLMGIWYPPLKIDLALLVVP